MGGRGSMGGTRSTYRGNSTSLFNARQQQGSEGDGSGGGGGGGSTNNGNGNNGTGGIEDGGGNGNGGFGGSVTEPKPNDQQSQLTEDQQIALFQESDAYNNIFLKRQFSSIEAEERAFNASFNKWRQAQGMTAPAEPAAPAVPEPAGLPFRKKATNARHTLEQVKADVETVNRLFQKDNGASDINCQRCTVAVELRAQGYDVKAQPITEGIMSKTWNAVLNDYVGTGASVDQIARQWKDKVTGELGKWDFETKDSRSRANAIKDMENEIVSWGEGARGFIYVSWNKDRGGGAHIWNVEVRDGKPFYIDGQTNEVGPDAEGWKDGFSPKNWRGVMRVDNREPRGTAALSWVKERSNEEINVPTRDEAVTQLNRLFPLGQGNTDLRNAFFAAWTDVYNGGEGIPSLFIASDIGRLQAFNQGLTWARRPD